jgi:hypothetical protein
VRLMRYFEGLFYADPRIRELFMTEDEIFNGLRRFYRPLTPQSTEQVIRGFLKEALERLLSIRYNLFLDASVRGTNNGSPTYRILKKRPPERNMAVWLARRLARAELRLERRAKTTKLKKKRITKRSLDKVRPLF